MPLLLCLLISISWAQARGHCQASASTILCNATAMTDFITAFYELSLNFHPSVTRYHVNIMDSSFQTLNYFPRLHVRDSDTIITLSVKNSSVEQVGDNALEELNRLLTLDLSFNKLSDISFARTLPRVLRILRLGHNHITYLDDVFDNLLALEELDLSHNGIGLVDFTRVQRLSSINFSHNRIATVLPVTQDYLRFDNRRFDLSHNKLMDSNEIQLRVHSSCLNMSSNELNSAFLADLPKLMRNMHSVTTVDLSNASITSIPANYFFNLDIATLKLNGNNITVLGKDTFPHSRIEELDLSHSKVTHIEKGAFTQAIIDRINLSQNNLKSTREICENAEIRALDLSFNPVKSIGNYSFVNCSAVRLLNLSNCRINKLEMNAFTSLTAIEILDLSYNKVFILESDAFNKLPVQDLRLLGNRIDTIRSNAFNQLYRLRHLNLTRTGLRNLEPSAFANFGIETVDLSGNNLTQMPQRSFYNVSNLREIYLNGNNITVFNFFDNRVRLRTLHLTFTGVFKASTSFNLHVNQLYIIDSHINVLTKGGLAGLYNLKKLSFDNSYVQMEQGALNTLFRLTDLDSQNLFRHERVIRANTFRDLASLPLLNLSHLSVDVLEPKAFTGMKSLTMLLLNNNNISSLNAGDFLGLESLSTLDVSSNSISNLNENVFQGLGNLMMLNLRNNKLTIIKSQILLGGLGNLLELHLDMNNISAVHVRAFSGLKSLQALHLQSNAIGSIPLGVFQYLPTLRRLNLRDNYIRHLKTGDFSNLQRLEDLDLSNNQLVNLEYVDAFFSLKALAILRVDGNHLKLFDFTRFLANARMINYVGISRNKWRCDTLSYILQSFNNKSIGYAPAEAVYEEDNIDGIGCIDICNFVYCT